MLGYVLSIYVRQPFQTCQKIRATENLIGSQLNAGLDTYNHSASITLPCWDLVLGNVAGKSNRMRMSCKHKKF